MTNTQLIGWTTTWTINDAKAFRARAEETSKAIQESEPGTVVYEWFLSDDEKTATIHEWFVGNEGAKAHLGGLAVTKFLPLLMESSQLTSAHVFGDVDDELRAALEQWNPVGIDGRIAGYNKIPAVVVA